MRKQPHSIRIVNRSISILPGVATWLFFAVFYRHHMHYQEQMQLFLTTSGYLAETASRPGGFGTYLGAFFTQFFYDSFAGGFFLALLMIALQRLVLDAANHVSYKPGYIFLTCLPSVAYLLLLLDENVLLSGLVASLLSLAAVAFANRIKGNTVRMVYFLLMIPMLYGLAGMACLVFVLLVLLTEWLKEEKMPLKILSVVTVAALLLFVLCPLAAKVLVVQYPSQRFWLAGDYDRYVLRHSLWPLLLFLTTAILPVLFKWLPEKNRGKKRQNILACTGFLLLLLASGWGIYRLGGWKKEEIMGYDYYARTQKWNSILAMADKKAPDGPLTVAMLNLALHKKGYLPDDMFTYYQNGAEGLIPDFTKEYIACVMTGEIYYHLGLVNVAQHFTFEAMELIPDYRKSVRCLKRLAETNLINGRYAVAEKYLLLLQNTLFYRKWATEVIVYLGEEERINTHPEWGTLRKYTPREDFLFSDTEKDMMCGILYQYNKENRMAYEYLLGYALLTKDLEHFRNYYRMGEGGLHAGTLPVSYQEALAYIWNLSRYSADLKPKGLDDRVVRRLEAYRKAYTNHPNPAVVLEKDFGDTYWYYYHFR